MADDATPSLQARIRSLPFPAVLALGGATGLLAAVLAAVSVEPAADGDAVATSTTPRSEAGVEEAPEAEAEGGAEGGGGSGKPGGDPRGAGSASDPSTPSEPPSDDDATANPADAEVEGAEEDDEEPIEVLAEPDVGGGSPSPSPASSSASEAPKTTKSPDRSAEAGATPDELFTMAKAAYDDGQYRDAYRLATKSQRAKASTRTQMLRGRAACRLKDDKNAKAMVRSFKLGDERRKELRGFCKDRGVRVGL